LIVLYLLRA